MPSNRRTKDKFLVTARNCLEKSMPEEPDEYFYYELLFSRHEQQIRSKKPFKCFKTLNSFILLYLRCYNVTI